MRREIWIGVLAAACSCGEYNFTAVPKCGKGQVLSGDGKALTCVDVSGIGTGPGTDVDATAAIPPDLSSVASADSAMASTGDGGDLSMVAMPTGDMAERPPVVVPACGMGSCLTGDNAGNLTCVDVTQTNQNLMTLQTQLAALTNRVTALENAIKMGGGGGGSGLYTGVTKATTNGRIVHVGVDIGLASAAAYCVEEFGVGAHMCTNHELYLSVAAKKLTAADTITPAAWVYFPSWQSPLGAGDAPLAGMGDNCASYTYPTAHRKWSGIAVEWKPNFQNDANAFWWHGGSEGVCNVMRPIVCCK